MKKLIEKQKDEIAEFYCDGCKKLVVIAGIPIEKQPETGLEFCVTIHGNFGYNKDYNGLIFDNHYCNDCGSKIVNMLETLFEENIKSPEFEDIDEK